MTDRPSVGRIVHYVGMGHSLGTNASTSTCRPAIITEVKNDTTVSIAAFSTKALSFYDNLPQDEGKSGGTWHWPERENGPTSSILPAAFKPTKGEKA